MEFTEGTAPRGSGGLYRASLDEGWKGWSPIGGYLAAISVRAAKAESSFPFPASLSCQFLSVGRFEEVDVKVSVVRTGSAAQLLAVTISQGERDLAIAHCWMTPRSEAFSHNTLTPPDIPTWRAIPGMEAVYDDWEEQAEAWPYMRHVEQRILDYQRDRDRKQPLAPTQRQWVRLRPAADYSDPAINAGRFAFILDLISWEAVKLPHPGEYGYFAPTLSLNIDFHNDSSDEWLLAEASAPIATGGRFAICNRLWDSSGLPLATATGTFLLRPRPAALP